MNNGDAANNLVNSNGACAACKHQRKRCDSNCQLACYFPAGKNEDFHNVHKLFGVNNLMIILNSVGENERDKTAETLILEAKMRRDFPVHGYLAVKKNLEDEIEGYEKEIDEVKKKLSLFKSK